MTEIEEFIKENFEPVDDKPGYVWFNKRNFQIISIETLEKCLEDARDRRVSLLQLFGEYLLTKQKAKAEINLQKIERLEEDKQ